MEDNDDLFNDNANNLDSSFSGQTNPNASFSAAAAAAAKGNNNNNIINSAGAVPPALLNRLRDIFKLLDENKNGRIHSREFPVALALADLDTTPAERTGLLAVHCADKDAGLTESEFLNICDVVCTSRKDKFEFSEEEMLRRAFDALASNEHGVVPIAGVLNWGEEVMRACDECLLMEHGFEYSDAQLAMLQSRAGVLGGSGKDDNKNKNKNNSQTNSAAMGKKQQNAASAGKQPKGKASALAAFGQSIDESEGDDDDNDHVRLSGIRLNNNNNNFANRELHFSGDRRGSRGGMNNDDDDAGDFFDGFDDGGIQPPRKLMRRGSQILMPATTGSTIDESRIRAGGGSSPLERLKLPEVAAQQQQTGNKFSSFSKSTLGGKTLVSHHNDISQVFGGDDVKSTTKWLLDTLAQRYRTDMPEGEKREMEMLLELVRAAGHNVESVAEILTKDAFVRFFREATSSDSSSAAAASAMSPAAASQMMMMM